MSSLIGNPLGTIVSTGVGQATGGILRPPIQDLINDANARYPFVPLDPVLLAAGVATGQVEYGWAQPEALNLGVNKERFDHLIQIANVGPGVGAAYELRRRNLIDDDGFKTALKRLGMEQFWITRLLETVPVLLTPAQIAAAVQQGHLPNPDVLPDTDTSIPTPPGYRQPQAPDDGAPSSVPLTQIDLDPVVEASKSGVDKERLRVEANLSGLPPGADTILTMWNRNLVTEASVDAGLREGHIKTKWAQAFKRMRWNVLGAAEYAGLWLRGWITKAEAIEGGALTGHTPEQMELLYKNRGRPMAPTQAYTAWARGAPHPVGEGIPDRPGTFDFADFERVIKQSDIRSEYVEPLWHNRFAYPSLFQLRGAVQSKGITPERARQIMHFQRYEEQDIAPLVASWLQGSKVASKGLTQAQLATEYEAHRLTEAEYRAALTQLGYDANEVDLLVALGEARVVAAQRDAMVTALKTLYLKHRIDDAQVSVDLAQLGISAGGVAVILPEWRLVRDAERTTLTASQIVSAYRKTVLTFDQAVSELETRGYSAEDARALVATAQPLLTVAQIIAAVRTRGITEGEGLVQLQALHYTPEQAQELMSTRIPDLTSAQIVKAVAAGTISRAEGLRRLADLGYRTEDATVLLPP